jgi:multidrug resistance efflux pump
MSAPNSDKAAAFKGLLVTAVLLFVMAYGIVLWTNTRFASHTTEAPAAPN